MRSSRVDTVFGIPGLHTLPFYDALAGTPSIRHILTRHEQGAAFAADGYARTLGRPGVLSTTTGPGTFNTLAAFAEAWSDSSPIVLLSGELRELAIRLGAPIATAVTGAGSVAADDDWCAGSVVAGRPEWTALFAEA